MSSHKCPSCGLINWSDAAECKRCRAPQQPLEATFAIQPPMYNFDEPKPAIALGILMIIWGVLMLAAGIYLLTFGKVSYALMTGSAILISGVSVTRGRQSVMVLYFVAILASCFWAAAEDKAFMGVGIFLYAGVIGLLVTKRRYPILAGFLIVLSCVGLVGAIALPSLKRPTKVAWREFRPAQGMFNVQMPAEPVARDSDVEQANGYTLKKHLYEATVRGQGSALFIVVEFSPALRVFEESQYEKLLEAELTNFVNNTGSTLRSKQKIMVNGFHGLSYELNPPANLALERPFMTGKIIINSDCLYVMHLTASQSSELIAGKDKFLTPTSLFAQPETVSDNQR